VKIRIVLTVVVIVVVVLVGLFFAADEIYRAAVDLFVPMSVW